MCSETGATIITQSLLANSANTECRPLQVKINCSKFIKDRLQSRTDFFIFFVCNIEKLIVWCISA